MSDVKERRCPSCDGAFDLFHHSFIHSDGCIRLRNAEYVTSLGAKRFQKADKPHETPAIDAIEAALASIREEPVDHVIVILAKDWGDGATNTRFFNAGSMNSLAQYGMLQTVLHLMLKGSNP